MDGPGGPDNLTWDGLGGLIAAVHPSLFLLAAYRYGYHDTAPSRIMRVDLERNIETLFDDHAGALFSGASVAVPELRPAAYNLLLVVGFLFAVQGLAVVSYFVARMQGPRLLRAAVVPMMILVPLGVQLLALLGLFDNWFNFRRWARPRDDKPSGPGSDQDGG